MKKITITPVVGRLSLHCLYNSQITSQPCFIDLDLETGNVSAGYNPEIGGNSFPTAVFNGIWRRYAIPCMTGGSANNLMEELVPLLQTVLDGSIVVHNGQNWVGRLTEEAKTSEYQIENYIDTMSYECIDSAHAYDIVPRNSIIVAGKSDDELRQMAEEIESDAIDDNTVIIDSVFDLLKSWRDEQSEDAE